MECKFKHGFDWVLYQVHHTINLFLQDFANIYYTLALPDSKEVDALQEKVCIHCNICILDFVYYGVLVHKGYTVQSMVG